LTEYATDIAAMLEAAPMTDDYDRLLNSLAGALSDTPSETDYAIDVQAIRKRTGLSQPDFAKSIGVPVATLRNWEQRHRTPTGPARVLLRLIDRNPRIVEDTLAG
jgi:DNA-binding transcriptional regulator YiaG